MFELKDLPSHATLLQFAARFPSLDISALETWLSLMRVSSELMADFEALLAQHGLSQTKFWVLILLKRNPAGLVLTQLAASAGVSNPTMTGIIDRMERDLLVARHNDASDRRAYIVQLTPSGAVLLDTTLPHHYEQVGSLLNPLSAEERAQLSALLLKLLPTAPR
ncbi:MarR family transcriptional regulator [Chitinivorax sp. PXF-14]|uniref:MarR family winged helix-turn-helix transcriptional regulator n=1 Tax=Chitinivorax sp. PXF-14 TaxID=3230488 RepID=UPI003467DF9B